MRNLWHSFLHRRYEKKLEKQAKTTGEPSFSGLVSQMCTQAQMRTPEYLAWCEQGKIDTVFRRKKWEYCYILQALKEYGQIAPGRRGLGFGVGRECLVPVLAKNGCSIMATDLPQPQAQEKGWVDGSQYAGTLAGLNTEGLCEPEAFARLVSYRDVNMNEIPEDLVDFDFLWSACAFEHLGSIERGLQFVERAMRCLKPGGIAVHTTEFNLASNRWTIHKGGTVLFRRKDIEQLARRLEAQGHWVAPRNYHPGQGELDHHVDVPPYQWAPHLRLMIGAFAATSFGIIIRKGNPQPIQ